MKSADPRRYSPVRAARIEADCKTMRDFRYDLNNLPKSFKESSELIKKMDTVAVARECLRLEFEIRRAGFFTINTFVPTNEGKMAVGEVTEDRNRVLLVGTKKQKGKYTGRYYDIANIKFENYQLVLGTHSADIIVDDIKKIIDRKLQ